jgi:hypothetical protein
MPTPGKAVAQLADAAEAESSRAPEVADAAVSERLKELRRSLQERYPKEHVEQRSSAQSAAQNDDGDDDDDDDDDDEIVDSH